MKIITLSLLLCFLAFNLSAQKFSDEWKDAFKNDNVEFIQKNVTKDNIDNCFDVSDNDYNLLSLAIKSNAKKILVHLLKSEANIDHSCGGKNALLYSAKYGNLEGLQTLLEYGADVNYKYKGRTALDYARKYIQADVVSYLVNLESKN